MTARRLVDLRSAKRWRFVNWLLTSPLRLLEDQKTRPCRDKSSDQTRLDESVTASYTDNMSPTFNSAAVRLNILRALFLTFSFAIAIPSPAAATLPDFPDVAIQTFLVGSNPVGVVFDGANIWVTNSGDDTVTKLRARDGALQGTFPVGDTPQEIAFDGANIWVANFFGDSLTKLRASDGALLGTFNGGARP
jgi:hypothetical protein